MQSKIWLTGLAMLLLAASPRAQVSTDVLDFQTVDLEGEPFHAASLKGRVVLLDFWAVWCPPCLEAFPVLNRLRKTFSEEEFQVLGIAVHSGDHDDVRQFLTGYKVEYPIVVGDLDLTERFAVIGFPNYLLIDANGDLHEQYLGEREDLFEVLSDGIQSLLNEGIEMAQGER